MEEQNDGVRKECVKKVTKKTSNVEGSSGKDDGEHVSDSVNVSQNVITMHQVTDEDRLCGHYIYAQFMGLVLRDLVGRYGRKGPACETHRIYPNLRRTEDVE